MQKMWSNRKGWTDDEIEKLRKLYPTMTAKTLASTLNRTESAVATKIRKLGIKAGYPRPHQRIPWPAADEDLLRRKYATTPARFIAERLNRSVEEIRGRARLLQLKSLPRGEKKKGTFYYYYGKPKFVVKANGCWEWIGAKNKRGYGMCNGCYSSLAHVQMYVERNGRLSWKVEVDHTCKNRSCVNPEHLEAVSHAVNVQRSAVAKLTVELVAEIRKSRQSTSELAREYNVTPVTIRDIKRRKTWR